MKKINPTTEIESEVEEFKLEDIRSSILKLKTSNWKYLDIYKRIDIIQNIITTFTENKEKIANTISHEMGKPKKLALIEVDRTIQEAEFYIKHSADYLQKKPVPNGYIIYQPKGVVAVISPWNFPIMLPFRSIIPALIAGNSVVFKPSELTPDTGKLISSFFQLPELKDAFLTVVGGKEHGKEVVNSDVSLISFTGSTLAGKEIFKSAANQIKHLVLELGGHDPAIVLDDIEIKETAKLILSGNIANSGQVCNAIKRAYVHKNIYQEFLNEIISLSKNLTIGEPENDPDLGPLVSLEQLNRVMLFVEDAKQKGAVIHSGGSRLNRIGYFYPSTIVTNITQDMKLMMEEPFGPILPIIPISNWQEAVELANQSNYGLAATVWTKDLKLAEEIAEKLEVGGVHINTAFAGGPGTPWGGCKESGIGRQKTLDCLLEYSHVKYVKNH